MRHAFAFVAIDKHLLNIAQTRQHAVMQGLNTQVLGRHLLLGDAVGLAHADNLVRGQGATAHTALMATTVHLRFQADAGLATHIQSTDALGSVGFVGCQAHQVDRQLGQIKLYASGSLGSIHMENHTFLPAHCTNGSNVLNHTDFVIHKHHTGQNGVRTDGRLERIQVHHAVGLHIEVGDFKTLAL